MEALLQLGTSALKKAALNIEAKEFVLSNPVLYKTLRKAAERYIGGETLAETLVKVEGYSTQGFKTSIEFMGESTRTVAEAAEATQEFQHIISAIRQKGLHATVSLDLSHIGLAISQQLCLQHMHQICSDAQAGNIEVIISAEGHERTSEVIDTYLKVQQQFPNTGITLQAYLHRSADDFQQLIQQSGRIRIVKGAFDTPAGISLPRGEQLNKVYLDYVTTLLQQGHLCSIATHDPFIQQEAKKIIQTVQPDSSIYEFESLYGIQTQQLAQLKEAVYPTKLYFVYGKEWYLYLCNRIAEYPLNIFQAINDIVT
jgi:proline dehydrogenase